MVKSTKNLSTTLPAMGAALAAEPIFHLGNFPVTNSMINAWIVTLFFIALAYVASQRNSLVPRGIHNAFEFVVVFLRDEMDKVTESRAKTKVFFPLVATLFLFILANNWLGLVPGTGSIGFYELVHGEVELVPLLRPATADLNLTLALAAFSVLAVQWAGAKGVGFSNYFSKFINVRGIFRSFSKGPTAIGVAFIEFFVGLLEIVGEFARIASLSLRLFGNVFAGEILIGVILSLASFVVPIPFMFLEIFVGLIQATVFALLVLVFLTVATMEHGHDEDEHHDDEHKPAHA